MAQQGVRGKRGTKPPYTSAADIDAFFERVRTLSAPPKVTTEWVKNMKLVAAQPEGVVAVLKWLGVIDKSGVPDADRWNKLRVQASRAAALGPLVRESYKGIFDRVDVTEGSRTDLEGAMIEAYSVGSTQRYIGCFQSLCGHADLSVAAAAANGETTTKDAAVVNSSTAAGRTKEKSARSGIKETQKVNQPGISIMLNVEIPADWNEEQIRDRVAAVTRAAQGG